MSELSGRVAVVLGGAAGIGRAACARLAAEGASVVVADRSEQAAERAAAEICASGGDAVAFRADAGSIDELRALFAFVRDRFGRLNVFFNVVGTMGPGRYDVTEAQFDHAFAINLKSHFFATALAEPLLAACRGQASLIYMSSGAGLRAFGQDPLYEITKSAQLMLMKAFAKRLAPSGIRANALCPGPVDTAFSRSVVGSDTQQQALIEAWSTQIPLGRIASPEDIADVVAFLSSDSAQYLTGLTIPIDGGFMV